jgi:hypothetical protein
MYADCRRYESSPNGVALIANIFIHDQLYSTTEMPLGIIDDSKLEHVPGTAPLNELGRTDLEVAASGIDRGLLKHDATGEIVLVPQPSDSLNDPYNWPRWKKEMFTVAIAYGCGCVGGNVVSPSFGFDADIEQPWDLY